MFERFVVKIAFIDEFHVRMVFLNVEILSAAFALRNSSSQKVIKQLDKTLVNNVCNKKKKKKEWWVGKKLVFKQFKDV